MLAMISHENGAAHVNDLKLVLIAVCVQIARQTLGDKVHLFHLLRRLGDQLLSGEYTSFKTVVGLNVFNIGVCDFASIKFEVFLIFLDHYRWFCCRIVFSLEDGSLAIKFLNFLNYSDEEAASVLMVRHNSQALGELSEDRLVVVLAEHGISKLGSLVLWNLIKSCVFSEI